MDPLTLQHPEHKVSNMIKRFILSLYVHLKVFRDVTSLQSFANVDWRLEIRSLSLSHSRVQDEHLLQLATIFPNLKRLDLGYTRVTDEGLVHLLSLSHLLALDINDTRTLLGTWDSRGGGAPPDTWGDWVWRTSNEPNFRREWLQNHLPDCTVWLRGNKRQSRKYPS